jgi:hypothetical protein
MPLTQANLHGQSARCSANRMGIQNQKKLQKPKLKEKIDEQFPLISRFFIRLLHNAFTFLLLSFDVRPSSRLPDSAPKFRVKCTGVSSMLRTPYTRMWMAGLHQAKHGMRSIEAHQNGPEFWCTVRGEA